MKYLVCSDIHGSLPVLEKLLSHYQEMHCDQLLFIGDLLNYGPRNSIPEGIDPQGIVKHLNAMAERIIAVRGNCDSEVDQMHRKIILKIQLVENKEVTLLVELNW